jgi:hypothetical protein
MFGVLSQDMASSGPHDAENQKIKTREELLQADRIILATAQKKPFFFSSFTNVENKAVKRAKADLGISQ